MACSTTAPHIQPSVASSSSEVGVVCRDKIEATSYSSQRIIHEIADSSPSSGLETASGSKINEILEDRMNLTSGSSQEHDVASPDDSSVSEVGDTEVSATIQELLRLGEVLQQRPSADSFLASS